MQHQRGRSGSASYQRIEQKFNRWSLIAFFFLTSIIIVLYVSNVLAIQKRSEEIMYLQQQYQSLLEETERLRRRAHQLQSAERIQEIAKNRLGLVFPSQPPIKISP